MLLSGLLSLLLVVRLFPLKFIRVRVRSWLLSVVMVVVLILRMSCGGYELPSSSASLSVSAIATFEGRLYGQTVRGGGHECLSSRRRARHQRHVVILGRLVSDVHAPSQPPAPFRPPVAAAGSRIVGGGGFKHLDHDIHQLVVVDDFAVVAEPARRFACPRGYETVDVNGSSEDVSGGLNFHAFPEDPVSLSPAGKGTRTHQK